MSFPCLESSAVVSSRSCSRSLKSCQENGVQVSIEPATHSRVHHIQRWSATSMSSQSSSSTVRSTTSSSLRTAISTSWSCSAIGCHALTLSVRNSRDAHSIPRTTVRVSETWERIDTTASACGESCDELELDQQMLLAASNSPFDNLPFREFALAGHQSIFL